MLWALELRIHGAAGLGSSDDLGLPERVSPLLALVRILVLRSRVLECAAVVSEMSGFREQQRIKATIVVRNLHRAIHKPCIPQKL